MDIKKTVTETDQTLTEFISLLSQISDDDFNKVPFAGSWTAGQLSQHIVLSAGGFVQLLNGPVTDTDRDPEQNVDGLRATFLNLETKFQSPDFICPESKNYSKADQITSLQNIKSGLLTSVQTLDYTMTCTAFPMPQSGYITRAEAATFIIVHTQRHNYQLKNIIEKLQA